MRCILPTTKMTSWWFKSLAGLVVAGVLVGCAAPLPSPRAPQAVASMPSAAPLAVPDPMPGAAPPAVPPVASVTSAPPDRPQEAAAPVNHPPSAGLPDARPAPASAAVAWKQRGRASWYGKNFHGRRTASGERFSASGFTAAHRTLPIPSYVRVRRVGSGEEVIVRINDRGPFHGGRVLDLSYAAAQKLGMVALGSAEVEIERLPDDDWRLEGARQAATSVVIPAIP